MYLTISVLIKNRFHLKALAKGNEAFDAAIKAVINGRCKILINVVRKSLVNSTPVISKRLSNVANVPYLAFFKIFVSLMNVRTMSAFWGGGSRSNKIDLPVNCMLSTFLFPVLSFSVARPDDKLKRIDIYGGISLVMCGFESFFPLWIYITRKVRWGIVNKICKCCLDSHRRCILNCHVVHTWIDDDSF